jgi:hypothetical protein
MISDAARAAFEHLNQAGLVPLTTDLQEASGFTTFGCALPVPQPNPEGLPEQVNFEVRLPAAFPLGKVAFIPKDACLDGFPHQASRGLGGTLCLLLTESEYPWDPKGRLLAHVQSAIEWVADAASSQLLKEGQPWELPDFRIAAGKAPTRPFFFSESSESLAGWSERVGKSGSADIGYHTRSKGIVPVRFSSSGTSVYTPKVSPSFCEPGKTFPCEWMLLPSFIHARHRSPRTFGELVELGSAAGVDVWASVRKALKRPHVDGHHYLLVGAPIPRLVGGAPVEIHWQAIAIPAKTASTCMEQPKGFRPRPGNGEQRDRAVPLLKDKDIPWSESSNVGGERMQVRGLLQAEARAKRVGLVGCGAIGSVLAEHLVRGGGNDVTLFDNDSTELQNLTRHTLAAADIGHNKAVALAARLKGIHPESTVVGFAAGLPLGERDKSTEAMYERIDAADILVDCSTNESVFRWASSLGREHGKLVIHSYANARARMLTVCCSGRHVSCGEVARLLYTDIREGRAPFSWEEYDPAVPEVEPGAGCWHPTFPAKGHDLAALVSAATPLIERLMAREFPSRGTAIVVRRNELAGAFAVGPLVETVFIRDYR